MSSVVIKGDTSGQMTLTVPAVAGTYTQTLPQITGTLSTLDSGTAVASTSGTSIDFTSIPAGVKRITVMFNGVSTNGTSFLQLQIGSGSVATTGYLSTSTSAASTVGTSSATTGFLIYSGGIANLRSGHMVLTNMSGNAWISSFTMKDSTTNTSFGAGDVTLGGTLDRVRITTINGTDTFDAGSINILYE